MHGVIFSLFAEPSSVEVSPALGWLMVRPLLLLFLSILSASGDLAHQQLFPDRDITGATASSNRRIRYYTCYAYFTYTLRFRYVNKSVSKNWQSWKKTCCCTGTDNIQSSSNHKKHKNLNNKRTSNCCGCVVMFLAAPAPASWWRPVFCSSLRRSVCLQPALLAPSPAMPAAYNTHRQDSHSIVFWGRIKLPEGANIDHTFSGYWVQNSKFFLHVSAPLPLTDLLLCQLSLLSVNLTACLLQPLLILAAVSLQHGRQLLLLALIQLSVLPLLPGKCLLLYRQSCSSSFRTKYKLEKYSQGVRGGHTHLSNSWKLFLRVSNISLILRR